MPAKKITEHIIVSDSGEVFPLTITNPYASLTHLIRQKLQKKDVKNCLHIYKITDLFMHRFLEYSDMFDDNLSTQKVEIKNRLLYAFSLILEHYINLLELAMKREKIPYDEIIV